MNTPAFIFLGTTDEVDTCDCCGKTNLKCTVAFEKADGATVYYGTTCAARHTGRKAAQWEKLAYEQKQAVERQVRAALALTVEYAEMVRVTSEARALRLLPGKAFRDFTAAAFDACSAKEQAIRAAITA